MLLIKLSRLNNFKHQGIVQNLKERIGILAHRTNEKVSLFAHYN